MLTSLDLENFRAFSKKVHIDFRPITVLIGRNSAGKSSVLKWLQMARQSVGTQPAGVFFQTLYPYDLGNWKEFRNKSLTGQSHHFSLQFSTPLPDLAPAPDTERTEDVGGPDAAGGRNVVREAVAVADFSVTGHVTYRQQQDFGSLKVEAHEAQDHHLLFRQQIKSLKGRGFLKPILGTGDAMVKSVTDDHQFLEPAREFISSLIHLGAVRRDNRSVIDLQAGPPGDVGHEGEYALPHLVEIFQGTTARHESARKFILAHAASVLGVEGLRVRKIGDGLTSRPEGRNAATNVTHRLNEFGFGVSQAVPIFVQGAIMERGACLTVEQPEAQLHPTAQLEMGSFFADLWTKRGVGSIIETHSSNILLRLRKLVRAGALTPDEVGVAYFHSDHGHTEVDNMKVTAAGELDGDLPMEFFGADLFEALEFNALPSPPEE